MLEYFSTIPVLTRKHLFICIMFTSAQFLQQSTQILSMCMLLIFLTHFVNLNVTPRSILFVNTARNRFDKHTIVLFQKKHTIVFIYTWRETCACRLPESIHASRTWRMPPGLAVVPKNHTAKEFFNNISKKKEFFNCFSVAAYGSSVHAHAILPLSKCCLFHVNFSCEIHLVDI